MVAELVTELSEAGVDLWEEAGKLRYRAPAGVMSADRLSRLQSHKEDVLHYLADHNTGAIVPDRLHRHDEFPLTDLQSAYLFGRSDAFQLGGVACHGYLEFQFDTLDDVRLSVAWNQLIRRHDMLRAIVQPDGSQRVLAEVPEYFIECEDVRERGSQAEQQAVQRFRDLLSHRNSDPGEWPLVELKVTLGVQRAILHLSVDLIVCDFQSVRLLLTELSAIYAGRPISAVPTLSFRDCVLAQRRQKEGPRFRRDREYWMQRIETLPAAPVLPASNRTVATEFFRQSFALDEAAFRRFAAFAGKEGVGVSAALLTVYAEVIGRWSAQDAFTLSLTVMQRDLAAHAEMDEIVGDFSSVELLGIQLERHHTFIEQVHAVQSQLWADLDHQRFSGVEVLREIGRQRGRDAAMFPVAFTSALASGSECRSNFFPGGKLSYGITQTPQVAIDCQIGPGEDGLILNWDIRVGAIPDSVARDMFLAFESRVTQLCNEGALWRQPTQIDLPAAQKQRRLAVNSVTRPLPTYLIHEPIFARADQDPEAVAVEDIHGTASYGELARRAKIVAKELLLAGCKPGEVVAVAMDKSIDQIVAVLGILRAGAAYLPMDIAQPKARRDGIFESANVRRLLMARADKDTLELPECIEYVFFVDHLDADDAIDLAIPARAADDLAYVIFTSGSTGTPKGVAISHQAAANTLDDIIARFGVSERDCVLGLASLGFDLSVFDIFGVLACGGRLILPDPLRRGDPSHWAGRANECGVTLWNSVPAQLEMLSDYLRSVPDAVPNSLRLALLSGDWIPVSLPARIRQFLPALEIIGLGGATEVSIWSIYFPIVEVAHNWNSIPYGKPLSNQRFYVLNNALDQCPDLVAGELYIGGNGLAQGYLGDAEKTAERFIRHPATGERIYRTGDFGLYLEDGNIEFLGRQDLQVKIRGHRIEIAEIETALTGHPHVNSAAVMVQGDSNANRRLVAFASTAFSQEKLYELAYLRDIVEIAAADLTAGMDVAKVSELAQGIERVSLLSMALVLQEQGVFASAAQDTSLDEVLAVCGVSSRNTRLIRRWLHTLTVEGMLSCDRSGRYRQCRIVDRSEFADLWARIEELAEVVNWGAAVLNYVRLSQDNLIGLMRDEVDPLHLLFPEGQTDVAEGAYRTNLVSRYMNGLVCAMIQHIALHKKHGVTRLLEVGAGVGGTSMDLIPKLQGRNVEYFFTDVSQYFLNKAEQRLKSYPWVRFGLFDINADHILQGIEPNTVDIVLCANVLHNSRHAVDVLRRLKEILVPGGWLVFIEATSDSYQIMSSMEFKEGLTEFQDCRQVLDTTFLTSEQWQACLREAGASTVVRLPGDNAAMADVGQHVFAAQFKTDRRMVSPDELRQYLSSHLPEYMVPAEIHVLDAIPVTNNGKIDRNKLASMAPKQRDHHVAKGIAPKDDIERDIASIWASLLRLDFVGTDQNFFDLGGDSLLVAQVVGRVRERIPAAAALSWNVILRRLLNEPTVAALANMLRDAGSSKNTRQGFALIELKRGETGPTILLVHDGSGTLTPYRSFLDALGEDQRVLGIAIEDPELFLAKAPENAITSLAIDYVERIGEALKREAPVHVVGYCMGSLLATEIARRLPDAGIAVAQLSVISGYRVPFVIEDDVLAEYIFARVMRADPVALGYPADEMAMQRLIQFALMESESCVAKGALARVAARQQDSASLSISALVNKGQTERLDTIGRHMLHAGTEFGSSERVRAEFDLIKHALAAVAKHDAQPYAGDITFIRQTGEVQVLPGMHEDMSAYWASLCGGKLSTIDVPGDHFSCMLTPNVTAVAAGLGFPATVKAEVRAYVC